MRVNRIPQGLRKRKIQDLIEEHAEKANPKPAAPVPVQEQKATVGDEEPVRKSLKRQRYGEQDVNSCVYLLIAFTATKCPG